MSFQRRTAGVFASPTPKGHGGERLCRNCLGPMPSDKRKHNCSAKCVEEWRCKTSPAHLRWVVCQRDKGICASCGLDTIALSAAVGWVRAHLCKYRPVGTWWGHQDWMNFTKALGIGSRWPGDLWDADHIIPVIEGGGECGLGNFRTLCIPCHKRVTREMHFRLAQARKEEKKAILAAALSAPLEFGNRAQISAIREQAASS